MMASFMGHVRRNLVAYVALLFALSGTSYAAATYSPQTASGAAK